MEARDVRRVASVEGMRGKMMITIYGTIDDCIPLTRDHYVVVKLPSSATGLRFEQTLILHSKEACQIGADIRLEVAVLDDEPRPVGQGDEIEAYKRWTAAGEDSLGRMRGGRITW